MEIDDLRLEVLKALSDETRLKLLDYLKHGEEICVCEIERDFDKSQSTLSRHLKTLEDADIIKSRKVGIKKFFSIKDTQVFKILAVIDNLIKRNKKYEKIIEIQQSL
ncbi:MAG: ArsR/SmtB family transcription factor [Promethearchaeati archaeon]